MNWGDPKSKPIFSPSKLKDFGCGMRYDLRWNKNLAVSSKLSAPPVLGTLVHAGEAAVDLKLEPRLGIQRAARELAKGLFLREDLPLLKQLSAEAETLVLGLPFRDGKGVRKQPESYARWVKRQEKETGLWEIIGVEHRFYADVGPLILAPKMDLVIKNEEGLWGVERKTRTDISDKAEWAAKWNLDVQILAQIATLVEAFPHDEVMGAMVRAVPYSRQNRRDWSSDLPQGLSSTKRNDPLWYPRRPQTEALFFDYLVHVRTEWEKRTKDNRWPAEGFANGMCQRCQFQRFCKGEISASALVKVAPEEIQVEEQKRNQKKEPKKRSKKLLPSFDGKGNLQAPKKEKKEKTK